MSIIEDYNTLLNECEAELTKCKARYTGEQFIMNIKLAEALLRRKELSEKVALLKQLDQKALYEVKAKRIKVTEDIDDIVAQIPKITASQVTQEHDWHARQLRKIDAAIQQANWTTEIAIDDEVMRDFQLSVGGT